MFQRLLILWSTIRDSLWFIPALLTLIAAVTAILTAWIDYRFESEFSDVNYWFLTGGADGSRLVLSTIAGSLITVTGVVFSMTIVALQLASTQFSPRILRNFMANRSNQVVLGVLISTFTYTLLVLRVVRTQSANGDAFVPRLSVALAIIMALVSVALLIYFIHHVARSIQPSIILDRVTDNALEHIAELFPREIGKPADGVDDDVKIPTDEPQVVAAKYSGYLLAVDGNGLFELGDEHRCLIRMTVPIGAFVVEGQTIAEVWADEKCSDEVIDHIRAAFVLGKERTPQQDVEYPILEAADMAVKALSPGINDPTTAIHCIDRLTEILLTFGKRRPPAPLRTESGGVHFLALPSTFDSAVNVAFGQILHFGRDNPAIVERLRHSIQVLEELLPAERQQPLKDFEARLDAPP